MSVYVYQSFQIKQEKFQDALSNLEAIKAYRNEQYDHDIKLLTPITGADHTYVLLSVYEGLAELELQNDKMFNDEEYVELIGKFFLEHIIQGSMQTQILREKKYEQKEDDEE